MAVIIKFNVREIEDLLPPHEKEENPFSDEICYDFSAKGFGVQSLCQYLKNNQDRLGISEFTVTRNTYALNTNVAGWKMCLFALLKSVKTPSATTWKIDYHSSFSGVKLASDAAVSAKFSAQLTINPR